MLDPLRTIFKIIIIILGFAFWPFMLWTALFSKRWYIRSYGPIKRGIPVRSESVRPKDWQFLCNLPQEVGPDEIQYDNPIRHIVVAQNQVMIYAGVNGFSTVLPYIAYIDLRKKTPQIVYRVSTAGVIAVLFFLLAFIMIFIAQPSWLAGLMIGLLILSLRWNDKVQVKALRDFLSSQTRQWEENKTVLESSFCKPANI